MSDFNSPALTLRLHPGLYAICRLAPDDPVPSWASRPGFCSITRTADELSIVCVEHAVPPGVRAEGGRRLLQMDGPLDLGMVGVLARLTATLAAAGISLFAVSTFDTDYLLIRDADAPRAVEVLRTAGYVV